MPTPTPQTITIEAHDKQREFLLSKAPNVVFQGGARSGKTWAGCLKALLMLRQYPGVWGMYVSPTYKQLQQAAMPHLLKLADKLDMIRHWSFNKSEGIISIPGGGTMLLRSAEDPAALLGATLGWAVGDEVALWRKQSYDFLQDRLSDPEGPRQAFFTFTPKGRNWAYEILGIPRDGLQIIHATTHDNWTLPDDYHQRLKTEHGEGTRYWQQEVLGEYVSWEGLVYQAFSIETHVKPLPADVQVVRTVLAVDWGWSNPGVMLPVQLLADGTVHVPDESYGRERPLEAWAEEARRLGGRYGVDVATCDPSDPANIAHLQRAGIRARKANNEVLPGITAVAGLLSTLRLTVDPSCENLIRELGMYSYKQRPDGTVRPDEPDKVDDHACDALRYGVMELLARPLADSVVLVQPKTPLPDPLSQPPQTRRESTPNPYLVRKQPLRYGP